MKENGKSTHSRAVISLHLLEYYSQIIIIIFGQLQPLVLFVFCAFLSGNPLLASRCVFVRAPGFGVDAWNHPLCGGSKVVRHPQTES
jgi:hypothetical protein